MSQGPASIGKAALLIAEVVSIVIASCVTSHSNELLLYSFAGGSDGAYPQAALIMDSNGSLYGTTEFGGGGNCNNNGILGCGTVFKVTPTGGENVLYTFKGGTDGSLPQGKLIADANANLYGMTAAGGADNDGTIFEISPDGQETVLYSFKGFGSGDGAYPSAGLLADNNRNLYGTTNEGGDFNCDFAVGCGTVFDVSPYNAETILYSFLGGMGGPDGGYPSADLIADPNSNLYGTTESGGGAGCEINGQRGCGTVFKIRPHGRETVLYAFQGGDDGSFPLAGLVRDPRGNLYGTTLKGGPGNAGTVFKISSKGRERVLFAFDGKRGANPYSLLILDDGSNLYGTTAAGGVANAGTVFKISPRGRETVLYAFGGGGDGANPRAGVIADRAGNLYGATMNGGAHGYGTVYKIVKNRRPNAGKTKSTRHHGPS